MPGFLERLRRRATSLSSTQQPPSLLPPPPELHIIPSTPVFVSAPPVARKIHPDVNSLLADYSNQHDPGAPGPSTPGPSPGFGLKPRTRRHSVDGSMPRQRPTPADTTEGQGTLDEVSEPEPSTPTSPSTNTNNLGHSHPPTPAQSSSPSPPPHTPDPSSQLTHAQGTSRTRRFLSRISELTTSTSSPTSQSAPSTGIWSTFGRNRSPRIGLGEFGVPDSGVGLGSSDVGVEGGEGFSQRRSQLEMGWSSDGEGNPHSEFSLGPSLSITRDRRRGQRRKSSSSSPARRASRPTSAPTLPPLPFSLSRPSSSTPRTPTHSQPVSRATSRTHRTDTTSTNTHTHSTSHSHLHPRPNLNTHESGSSQNSHSHSHPSNSHPNTPSILLPLDSPISPHTFGYPTPSTPSPHAAPHSSSSDFTFGPGPRSDYSSSPSTGWSPSMNMGMPIPPMPPLDHPAFHSNHAHPTSSQAQASTTLDYAQQNDTRNHDHDQAPSTSQMLSHSSRSKARSASLGRSTKSSTESKRKSKSQTRKLNVQDVFPEGAPSASRSQPGPEQLQKDQHQHASSSSATFTPRGSRIRIRARTLSTPKGNNNAGKDGDGTEVGRGRKNRSNSKGKSKSRSRSVRRSSADWSAHQASVGLGGGSGDEGPGMSWEAEVSREILRISLGVGRSNAGGYTYGGTEGEFGIQRNGGTRETEPARFIEQQNRAGRTGINPNTGPHVTRGHNQEPGDVPEQENEQGSSLLHDQDTDNLSGTRLYDDLSGGSIPTTTTSSPTTASNDKGKGRAMAHHDSSSSNPPHDQDRDGKKPGPVPVPIPMPGKGKGPSRDRRTTTPSPPKSAMRPQVSTAPSLLQPPALSFTAPTPDTSPGRRSASQPDPPSASALSVPPVRASSSGDGISKGKRKADDVEGSPPKEKEAQRATFAEDPRPHRPSANSGSSRAPSSYHRKRARISTSEPGSRPPSRDREQAQNAATTGSWSSRSSSTPLPPSPNPPRALSRATSRGSARATSTRSGTKNASPGHAPRRSMSQASIPISALVSPHAPSLSAPSNAFHMRDPRKPPKPYTTPWSLHFASPGEPGSGSPVHAWLFFIGFVLFPVWWVAAWLGIPRTRKVGGTDVEKAVMLDDPQVEYDARSWRTRCRVVAVVSLFTYIPFIVLVAIFAR